MRNVYGERIAQEERAHVVEDAILEFYQSAKAASKGKFLMRKPFGFFHVVLESEASAHVRRRVRAMQPGTFDWLEA